MKSQQSLRSHFQHCDAKHEWDGVSHNIHNIHCPTSLAVFTKCVSCKYKFLYKKKMTNQQECKLIHREVQQRIC